MMILKNDWNVCEKEKNQYVALIPIKEEALIGTPRSLSYQRRTFKHYGSELE